MPTKRLSSRRARRLPPSPGLFSIRPETADRGDQRSVRGTRDGADALLRHALRFARCGLLDGVRPTRLDRRAQHKMASSADRRHVKGHGSPDVGTESGCSLGAPDGSRRPGDGAGSSHERRSRLCARAATLSSPRSLGIIKRQVWNAHFETLAEAVAVADAEMHLSQGSEDFKEGSATSWKRGPSFSGR